MIHVERLIKNKRTAFIVIALSKLATLFKINFVVGSQVALFSAANAIIPLIGTFCTLPTVGLLFSLRILWRLCMYKMAPLSILAFYIPGLCASLYFSTQSSIIRLFLPISCMILFTMHPIGGQACIYTLYWLIPMVLYFIPRKSIFLHSLASTFIAHAVGSVIWLYTVPMTASMWFGLLPVVAVERLLYAVGMVIAYHAIIGMTTIIHRLKKHEIIPHFNRITHITH